MSTSQRNANSPAAHQKPGDPTDPTITLTLQTDTITTRANNAVFDAPLVAQVATLQTGDSIVDTGTGGTLNAFFNPVATNIIGAKIDGVPTWNLTNVGTFNYGEGNTQIITGGTLVTGLTTLNDLNSGAPIVVGVTGASLQSALTTVGLTDTDSQLTVLIAASALSGTNDSLTVNLDNAGVVGSYAQLTVGPDSNATNGYENWKINGTGNNFLDLSDGTATTAKTMTFSDSGNMTLSFNDNSFANVTTINASSATGNVSVISSADLTGVYGVGSAGHLTVVEGGSGNDTFDLSYAAYTPAVINAMTTLSGGTGHDETLILNNATLTSGVALTKPTHFETFGDTDPSGIINMTLLPSSVNEIEFFGYQTGALTLNTAPATFTVDAQAYAANEITVNAANTAVTTNTLSILMGSNQEGALVSDLGQIVALGYGTVNISAIGLASVVIDQNIGEPVPSNTFTANPGGSEIVNVTGTAPLSIEGPVILSGTSTTIHDTDTALVYITSTNAAVINAVSSGGLDLGADTNYSGTTGDIITGSATAANSLGGSLGNDVITASKVGGDHIFTNGGADTIILNVHAVGDTIQLTSNTGSSVTDYNDLDQAGFWGVPPSGVGGGIVPAASTSADQSVVTNFNAAVDILQFATAAWGSNASGFEQTTATSFDNGLTYGDGHSTVYDLFSFIVGYIPPATVLDITVASATLSATANVMEVTGATFANAAALATALGSTYQLTFGGTGVAANTDAHMLFIYNDPSGKAHVADVDFENGSTAATTTTAVSKIVASDMVELVGVSEASLTANNIHFV